MAGVLQFLSLLLISFIHLSFIFVVPVVIPVVAEDVWSSLPCFGQSCSYNYVLLEAWLHSMWMLVQYLWLHLSFKYSVVWAEFFSLSCYLQSVVMSIVDMSLQSHSYIKFRRKDCRWEFVEVFSKEDIMWLMYVYVLLL